MEILLVVLIDAIAPTRLPSLFHAAGCRVNLFSPAHLAIRRSRYVDNCITAPSDPNTFTEYLRRYLDKEDKKYGWVQLGDECVLRAIIKYHSEEWSRQILPVETWENANLITDKLAFLSMAEACGIRVPNQVRFASLDEFLQSENKFNFPLVIKFAESLAGSGVRQIDSRFELTKQEWDSEKFSLPVLVQEYLVGNHGSTEVLFDHGRPVAWISCLHQECWPTPLAAACVREIIDLADIEVMLLHVGSMTGYHGLAGIDWISREGDGQLYFIEFNPRPTPCYHLGPRAGVDFAKSLRQLLEGSIVDVQRPANPLSKRAIVHQFPQYCYRAIDDHNFSRMARVLPDIPWNDPLLVAALVRRVLTHNLPTEFRDLLRNVSGRNRLVWFP